MPSLDRKDFVLVATQLPRYEQCPATGVYRIGGVKEKIGYGMWYGIFVHRFLEYALERGRDAALEYIRTKKMKKVREVCEAIDTDALPTGRAEVAMLFDPSRNKGREMYRGESWELIDVESEQYVKSDLVSASGAPGRRAPLIGDYKCGPASLELHPAESTQLLAGAAAWRAMNRDGWGLNYSGRIDVALITVLGTGELVWRIVELDDRDLDAYTGRARRVHLRVLDDRTRADSGNPPDFVPGPMCDHCELQPVCPAR